MDYTQTPARSPGDPVGMGAVSAFRSRSPLRTLLDRRGWTPEVVEAINDPSHGQLKDSDALAARLHLAKARGEQVVVLPDFDMDGVTSGVLAWAGLAELGIDVGLYVPDYRRGHDVTPEAVQEAHEQFPRATVMITTDSGVNSHEGIGHGRSLGISMLVTDHHVQLDERSPAEVVVDPERIDEDYAHPGICGAYVIYQCLMTYARAYAPEKLSSIRLLSLFAGIGTVSDVMPLLYENRKVVRDSLSIARLLWHPVKDADLVTEYDPEKSVLMQVLRSDPSHAPEFVSAFEGFAVALKAFREHGPLVPRVDSRTGGPLIGEDGEPVMKRSQGKLRQISHIEEGFYGFYLAPAFNAIRRVGGSMHDAFGVFTAPSAEQKLAHAEAVIDVNEERKRLTEEWMAELEDELAEGLQPYAHVGVWLTEAPGGMLGLMASKLMREDGRPVAVIRRQADPSAPMGGSMRSPSWYPVISTLTPLGFTAVGHENACGVRLRDAAHLAELAEALPASADAVLSAIVEAGGSVEEKVDLVLGSAPDADHPLDSVDDMMELARGIDGLRPFGHGFRRPEVELVVDLSKCSFAPLGSKQDHLRITLPIGMKMLWWGAAERISEMKELAESSVPGGSVVRFRVSLSINAFMGAESVQAVVEEMLPQEGDGADEGYADDEEVYS